jgi:chemotaxis protein MotB
MKKQTTTQSSNFWISYADLMAGLLFVFILLIGAIIVKSSILKKSLEDKSQILEQKSLAISQKDKIIAELQELLKKQERTLQESNQQIIILSSKLKEREENLTKLNSAFLDKLKEESEYKEQIVILTDELNRTANNLAKVSELLNSKEAKYSKLLERFQAQREKIKYLTGIKLKVIAKLKEALGDKINIDKRSGTLRLSSNILFDKGSATLKDGAKSELKSLFIDYIETLISDDDIRKYLDLIVIEGHTDSDGSFMYNLELSQKRAYAVMNYLLSLDYVKKHNIKDKLVASGRSYLDPILVNGLEDKDASRRIEIKFRLKNQEAMEEIEKILDEN